ncbi:MAG: hypothetical protein EU551_02060 [Promethearchaeota archaeon]|nr:MAG: hypothetical protein EU551_02060 [Candidatus Lokiarchaeota archaeon]
MKLLAVKRKEIFTILIVFSIILGYLLVLNGNYSSNVSEYTSNHNNKIDNLGAESRFYEFIPTIRYYDPNCSINNDNLKNLRFEKTPMWLEKTYFNAIGGSMYIEYEIYLNEAGISDLNSYIISAQVSGETDVNGQSNISLEIYDYSSSDYTEIYTLTGVKEYIFEVNGYIEVDLLDLYNLSQIEGDLLNSYVMKLKFSIESEVEPALSTDFKQYLFVYWCKLIGGKDISIKEVAPTNFMDLTGGIFHLTGNLDSINNLDGSVIKFGISDLMPYQTISCDFYIEYDLGIYANTEILGVLFHHLDWIEHDCSSYYQQNPYISIFNYSKGNITNIQNIRKDPDANLHSAEPERWDSKISVIGRGLYNQSKMRVYYHVQLTNLGDNMSHISVVIDLASLSIVRSIGPMFGDINIMDEWVYCGQSARVNGTVEKGKYDIQMVQITPINQTVAFGDGFFMFAILNENAGLFEFYLEAIDIEGYSSTAGPFYINFHKKPVIINTQIYENPYPNPPQIQLDISIRDAIELCPLSNAFFDVTVEKEGDIIDEYKNVQADPDGKYNFIYETNNDEYLDTEYTFIVRYMESLNFQFSSTYSYITPSFAPSNVSIVDYEIKPKLWAGDRFNLSIMFYSLADIQDAWLLLNETEVQTLNLQDGINNLNIINNKAGLCEYKIRVLNTKGYINYSNSISLYFNPNPINYTLKFLIDEVNTYIFMNISIKDLRTNRSLANIPIDIEIYDNQELFWDSSLTSTLPYTPIYIQFDLSKHNFSIEIKIGESDLYEGGIIKTFHIPFEYTPYPYGTTITTVILAVIAAMAFVFKHRKTPKHVIKEE